MRISSSRTQHAIRLLSLLSNCGEATGGNDPKNSVSVIRAEKKLQALDFWMRNPDYLADEIVTAVEQKELDSSFLQTAESLLNDQEPNLRHFPMHKWFFGAYEAVDDAFALLQTYGFAQITRRGTPGRRLQNQFFLTQFGAEKAKLLDDIKPLDWYPKQAKLVSLVAREDSGSRLKERQYQQESYARTVWGNDIGSITEQVRKRLEDFTNSSLDTGVGMEAS
ncbi:hypothetical protein N24_1704 [Corynebacterium suranareeae]|uniref:Uncharacterized protein n=1 Tax=Corynebacterium suranareeae TaxID=2506452 RepID=A0A160PQS6_9CORY|nr:hypothetical protein [Corynebacterium suranareeae]BAU95966.1 hypothetical protein N24_1704 [Corynebacterium suranareeae]